MTSAPGLHEEGVVLGVDVGWAAENKTTGACLLEWTATTVRVSLRRLGSSDTDGLKRLVAGRPILALAVDGPVRGSLDLIGVYRDAEMMLTRGLAGRIGKPGQSSSGNGRKLNEAANAIVRMVLSTGVLSPAVHRAKIHESAFVEAFPTSFLGVMLDDGRVPPHGPRSDAYFLHLLGPSAGNPPPLASDRLHDLVAELLPGRHLEPAQLAQIRDHEERAALICALTALCVVARKYVAVGDPANGYIILPPRAAAGAPGLQPWAWSIIEANRRPKAPDAIVVESGAG